MGFSRHARLGDPRRSPTTSAWRSAARPHHDRRCAAVRFDLDAPGRAHGARGAAPHLSEAHPGVEVELLDLRDEHHVEKDGIYVETVRLPGDPRGGVAVDLGRDSAFAALDGRHRRYYGAYYDWAETNLHHRDGRHEYRLSKSPLSADVFISIPKLKNPQEVRLTVNLKALVGINANKNCCPITRSARRGKVAISSRRLAQDPLENAVVMPAKQLLIRGVPAFKEFARRTKRMGYEFFGDTEQVVRSGNWHGNDTVVAHVARSQPHPAPRQSRRLAARAREAKRYFSVVDGIVAMERNGPVRASAAKPACCRGHEPVAVDTVCARLMASIRPACR